MQPAFEAAAALGLVCRPMVDADLPFVAALFASTRAEEVAATGWPEATQAAFLEQQHQAQHRHYRAAFPTAQWLIVEREGKPIGRFYIVDLEHEILLIDMSFLPESRGGGYGGALFRDILAFAQTTKQPVSLAVERTNRAQLLYERLGFRDVEEMGFHRRMVWQPAAD